MSRWRPPRFWAHRGGCRTDRKDLPLYRDNHDSVRSAQSRITFMANCVEIGRSSDVIWYHRKGRHCEMLQKKLQKQVKNRAVDIGCLLSSEIRALPPSYGNQISWCRETLSSAVLWCLKSPLQFSRLPVFRRYKVSETNAEIWGSNQWTRCDPNHLRGVYSRRRWKSSVCEGTSRSYVYVYVLRFTFYAGKLRLRISRYHFFPELA